MCLLSLHVNVHHSPEGQAWKWLLLCHDGLEGAGDLFGQVLIYRVVYLEGIAKNV